MEKVRNSHFVMVHIREQISSLFGIKRQRQPKFSFAAASTEKMGHYVTDPIQNYNCPYEGEFEDTEENAQVF